MISPFSYFFLWWVLFRSSNIFQQKFLPIFQELVFLIPWSLSIRMGLCFYLFLFQIVPVLFNLLLTSKAHFYFFITILVVLPIFYLLYSNLISQILKIVSLISEGLIANFNSLFLCWFWLSIPWNFRIIIVSA